MHKALRFLLAGVCLFGFVWVRFRESGLFYDPLIDYFHGDYQNNPLPTIAKGELFLHLFFRYAVNMALSFGVLWAVFVDRHILKFASLLYSVAFLLLALVMYVLLQDYDPKTYLPLFYVRRFLIQPLLIFLLLPAFFYSRKVNN